MISQASPVPCHEKGQLIAKLGCYALRRDDGKEIWLELDAIPHHLIERPVHISGRRFAGDLIEVELIGPL